MEASTFQGGEEQIRFDEIEAFTHYMSGKSQYPVFALDASKGQKPSEAARLSSETSKGEKINEVSR